LWCRFAPLIYIKLAAPKAHSLTLGTLGTLGALGTLGTLGTLAHL